MKEWRRLDMPHNQPFFQSVYHVAITILPSDIRQSWYYSWCNMVC